MEKIFPFINWLRTYSKQDFLGDLSAGITVGVMLIPQGMAYAMLAGMPPIYGLYAATIPLIIYAIFGTSRQLAVGPVALVSLLIASGVGAFAVVGSESFIGQAILLSLMVGVIQLILGLLKLGFLVNYLSHPVVTGFTSAAAIIIGVSQLKHLLGLDIPRGKVHVTLSRIFEQWGSINSTTLILGASAIVLIIVLKRIHKRIPTPLVVVLLGMWVVQFFDLQNLGVNIVQEVPSGLPKFAMPDVSLDMIQQLLPMAVIISMIGFMESIAVSRALQNRHKNYEVVPNQELKALGLANIGGAFFQAFPVMGGFARSAVNDQAGAKTGVSAVISALLVMLTLLFLTSYFYFLPKAVLAAIILVAIYGLIDFKEAKHLWQTDKKDFALFMITVLATIFWGVEQGILTGIIASIAVLLYNLSYPHMAELGVVPNTMHYRNVNRFKDLEVDDELLIVRLDAQLFFANTVFFQKKLKEMAKKKNSLKAIVLNAEGINGMDSSAAHMLCDMVENYRQNGVQFYLANVKGPIRDRLKRADLVNFIGKEYFYLSVNEAVDKIKGRTCSSSEALIFQTNV